LAFVGVVKVVVFGCSCSCWLKTYPHTDCD